MRPFWSRRTQDPASCPKWAGFVVFWAGLPNFRGKGRPILPACETPQDVQMLLLKMFHVKHFRPENRRKAPCQVDFIPFMPRGRSLYVPFVVFSLSLQPESRPAPELPHGCRPNSCCPYGRLPCPRHAQDCATGLIHGTEPQDRPCKRDVPCPFRLGPRAASPVPRCS